MMIVKQQDMQQQQINQQQINQHQINQMNQQNSLNQIQQMNQLNQQAALSQLQQQQSNGQLNQTSNQSQVHSFPQFVQQPVLHHPMALYHHSINTPRMQQPTAQTMSQPIIQSINSGTSSNWEMQQQWVGTPMPQMALPASHPPSTPALSPSYTMQSPAAVPLTATATPAADPSSDPKRRKAERGARKIACTFCHTAKTVCVGGRPCERCIRLQKAEHCVDRVATHKRHKREEQNGLSDTAQPAADNAPSSASSPATKQSLASRPIEDIVANGNSTIALDSDSAWTAIPDLIHSSFFQCLLVPQRAYPAVKLEETIKNILYVLTYLHDSLSESQFRRAIAEMGYSPTSNNQTQTSAQTEPGASLPISTQTNVSTTMPEGKVLWRSTYSHLPDISIPMQFSFNWNVSPSTALHETTIASIFPTLIVERGTPVLPHIPLLHGPIDPNASADVKDVKDGSLSPRYRLNELDLPLSVQVNDKFEYVFAWTQSEVKLLFSRHGRRAMEKLSVGNFTPALATLRDLLDGRAEFAHTVMIRNKYGNEIAAVEHKRLLMSDSGWFERIVWTWIPLSP